MGWVVVLLVACFIFYLLWCAFGKNKCCTCLSIIYPTGVEEDNVKELLLNHLRKFGWRCVKEDDIDLTSQPHGVDGQETKIEARIFCKNQEICTRPRDCGVNSRDETFRSFQAFRSWVVSFATGVDGLTLPLIDLIGPSCIRDLTTETGVTPISCDYDEEFGTPGDNCETPPALRHAPISSHYQGEATLDATGGLVISEDGSLLNKSRGDEFNVVIPCEDGYSSKFKDELGAYYVRATCPLAPPASADSPTVSPQYYYTWGNNELGKCEEPCAMPAGEEGSISRTILPNHNPNFADFRVRYQCNTNYSPRNNVPDRLKDGGAFIAQTCDAPGDEFKMDVDCIPDCTHPPACQPDAAAGSECPFYSEAFSRPTISQKAFANLFDDLECADAFAPSGDLTKSVCADEGGEYTISGCQKRCTAPDNVGYYTVNPPTDLPSKDDFRDWTQHHGLSCAAGADTMTWHIPEHERIPTAHVCNNYGEEYGLTGCYPACAVGAKCLNLKIIYPAYTPIDETSMRRKIVDKLNMIQDGTEAFDDTFISYYNKVNTTEATIIEYQIKCPLDNCEVLKDQRLEDPDWMGWYNSQQETVAALDECDGDATCISKAAEEARQSALDLDALPICPTGHSTNRDGTPRHGYGMGAFIEEGASGDLRIPLWQQIQQGKTSCAFHTDGETWWIGTNPNQPAAIPFGTARVPCQTECKCPSGTTSVITSPVQQRLQQLINSADNSAEGLTQAASGWEFACVDPCIGVNCQNGGVCKPDVSTSLGYCDCSTTDTDGEGNPLWGGPDCSTQTDAAAVMDDALSAMAEESRSDRRLKKDIRFVGLSPSGLRIYHFRYKDIEFGEGLFQGVMSDEIPEYAVIKHPDGYDRVNYNVLDVEFKLIN